MNDRTQQLLDRTFYFGVNTMKFLRTLPDNYIYRIPKGQGAVSKMDFTNKIGTSYKEAKESLYWLRVLRELYSEEVYRKDFEFFLKESQELRNIFAAIKKSSEET